MASPPVSPYLSRMTSGYGPRPGRRSGRITVHQGIDFAARRGDPIYAADGGQVGFIARDARPRRTRGYGNLIAIQHSDGFWSVYAHLSKVYVQEGQNVTEGQLIGAAGSTTNRKFRGMGPHLHFEVRSRPDGGRPIPSPYGAYNVDPEAWLASRGVDIGGDTIVVNPAAGGTEPALMQQIPRGLSGLGQGPSPIAVVPAIESAEDDETEGLPEEPVRDPWTFQPLPAGGIILMTALVALPVVVGVWGARALAGGA